jgi:hypothetical protein
VSRMGERGFLLEKWSVKSLELCDGVGHVLFKRDIDE